MYYRRHVTAGRLSELTGHNIEALAADKVIRTMGWRKIAEQEWELLNPDTKAYLDAYAEGVNDYIAKRAPSELAVEYTVLDLQVQLDEIEPWDPIDSLAWLKAMAWDLKNNFDQELDRALVMAEVNDVGRVNELFPIYDEQNKAPIIVDGSAYAPETSEDDESDEGEGGDDDASGAQAAGAEAAATIAAAAETSPGLNSAPADTAQVDTAQALAAAHEALNAVPTLFG